MIERYSRPEMSAIWTEELPVFHKQRWRSGQCDGLYAHRNLQVKRLESRKILEIPF